MPKAPAATTFPAEVGAADLARLLGIGPRRLRELAELGVVPRTPRGRYPFADAVAAYVAHLREVAAGRRGEVTGDDGDVLDLATERARLARSQRELAEIKKARELGELVDAEAVKAGFTNQVTAARNRLLGVPSEAKQRIPHLTIEEIETIEDLVGQALQDVADGAGKAAA